MSTEKVVSKEQCPLCVEDGLDTTGDNLVTFESGVKHCFRHGVVFTSNNNNNNNNELPVIKQIVDENQQIMTKGMIEGTNPIASIRGISPKTMTFYGYQINKELKIHIANYYDAAGKIVMQQHRNKDKTFPVFGNKNFNGTLYGQWKFTPDERVFITITEGQLDALSVAEVFDCKYPCVSLPHGASSAATLLRENQKYLDGFKYIVLAFDNDHDGKEATEKCLKLFEPGKIRIADFGEFKDANEMLKLGLVSELRKLIYGAVEYIPAPILTGQAWLDKLDGFYQQSFAWPWPQANKVIQPIYIPGIYTIAALPGVGKTKVVASIMKDAINRCGKVGVISLEETDENLLMRLSDMLNGTKLLDIANRDLTTEEKESCRKVSECVVTYDHNTYGSKIETILDNLPYIAQSLNCEIIIFDNLSYSATDEVDDERRGIDKAMIHLKNSSTKYSYALFNVCHLKDKESSQGKPVNFKFLKIRGSNGPQMYSDYVIYLGRNTETQNPIERNQLEFFIKKDRRRGTDTGKSFILPYDVKTGDFKDF